MKSAIMRFVALVKYLTGDMVEIEFMFVNQIIQIIQINKINKVKLDHGTDFSLVSFECQG